MPVYMSSLMNAGKHLYTITLCVCVCVCVCVYVRQTPEAGSLVVIFTRQFRLLLNKYSMSPLGNSTLGQAHTHRVIVYICSPTNSMTTCRPASVLILIYDPNIHAYCTLTHYKMFIFLNQRCKQLKELFCVISTKLVQQCQNQFSGTDLRGL